MMPDAGDRWEVFRVNGEQRHIDLDSGPGVAAAVPAHPGVRIVPKLDTDNRIATAFFQIVPGNDPGAAGPPHCVSV